MAYNFPDTPTVGQGYSGYVWDGEKWLAIAGAPNQSGVISIQVFTSSGTYVPSPNMTTCVIECVGGGGGGGGAASTAASQFAMGGGGAGGSYSRSQLAAAQVGVSQVVTVGAGGTPASGANGGAGNISSFGAFVTAPGGGGGAVGSVGATSGGAGIGSPGAVGTGTLTIRGGPGGTAGWSYPGFVLGGVGGAAIFGAGGATAALAGAGAIGFNYGGGGGGACSPASTAVQPGGAGAPGLVVITEYGMIALSSSNAQGMVRFDLPQSLTANQTAQARANINVTKRNYIINGGMQISQENGATVGNVTAYYPVDMFSVVYVTTGTVGTAQVTNSLTPSGSRNRLRVVLSVADTSIAAGEFLAVQTAVEGLRGADLGFGTGAAKGVTIQFGVRAPAGTYCVTLMNASATRSYVAEYVIAAGEANTDVVKAVTIAGDTTGTWPVDNTVSIFIRWGLMAGTTFQQAAGSWGTGNPMASPTQFNFMGNTSNIFELFDVSLTEGSVAPPFQLPDYPTELALCQRYFYKRITTSVIGYGLAGAAIGQYTPHPVKMRGTPTSLTVSNPVYGANSSAATADTPTVDGYRSYVTATATAYTTASFDITVNARL